MEKTLEAYNDVFADIVNVLLFQGERLVKEEDLEDGTPQSMYKTDGKLHEQERDVAKYWKDCNVRIALYGFENQTEPETDMPLRVISYDGAAYRGQLLKGRKGTGEEKEAVVLPGKKHFPVVTLVLYFGAKHWDKPLSLSGCLEIPDRLHPYVNDYRINLFEISWLEGEQVERFTSDFRIVADYFVQMRKHKEYHPSEKTMEHVNEVLKLMSVLTNDSRFEDVMNDPGKGEIRNMCEVLDRVEARGEKRGKELGEAIGETNGICKSICGIMGTMKCTAEQAMDMMGLPVAERKKYLTRINGQQVWDGQ